MNILWLLCINTLTTLFGLAIVLLEKDNKKNFNIYVFIIFATKGFLVTVHVHATSSISKDLKYNV